MTPEELEELIRAGEPPALAAALEGLSEKERAALDEAAFRLYKKSEQTDAWGPVDPKIGARRYQTARLAVIGLCKAARAHKVFLWMHDDGAREALVKILDDRRPAWLKTWVEKRMEPEFPEIKWETLNTLVQRGALERPRSEGYYRVLATSQGFTDPAVLELDLWGLFEHETVAFTYDWTEENWSTAVPRLCREGSVPRGRLLDAALTALGRDWKSNTLSGFRQLLENLEPAAEEMAERQAALRELLASSTSHVVGFALKQLARVEKLGRLEGEAFLQAASPALRVGTKGTAMRVLRLAARVGDAGELAAEALAHPSPDVQRLALELAPPELAAARQELLAPALRPAAEPVQVPQLGPPPEEPAPLGWQALGGLERVTPIADLDELIDAVAAGVETLEGGEEVERILDGLSRLGAERPPDFELRTRALLTRVEERRASDVVRGLTSGWAGLSASFRDLLLTWLTGRLHGTPMSSWYREVAVAGFLRRRLQRLSERLGAGPLLALPTHRLGWIEPVTLVDRLAATPAPAGEDLVAALLRLAPEGREEALEAARGLSGWVGRVVRFGLGSDERPGPGDRKQAAVWLAAGKCRQPDGDLRQLLRGLGLRAPWPDALEPGSPAWRLDDRAKLVVELRAPAPEPALQRLLGMFRLNLELDEVPTAALSTHQVAGWETVDLQGLWPIQWMGLTWPVNPDGHLLTGARAMLDRWDLEGSAMAPYVAFLEPLTQPRRAWSDASRLVLWLAALGKDADGRGAALDLLVEGVEDGRAHPVPLAATLLRLAPRVKSNRLAGVLEELGRLTPLSAAVAADLLDRFLAGLPELPHAAHHLLQVRLDLAARLGTGPSAELRERLAQVRGSGKAASLCKELLA